MALYGHARNSKTHEEVEHEDNIGLQGLLRQCSVPG